MRITNNNYWFIDDTWLKGYVASRILVVGKEPQFETEVSAGWYQEMYQKLLAERGSILSMEGGKAVITGKGPITKTGPDLYDLYYGIDGVSYAELDEAIMEADEIGLDIEFHVDTPGGDASGTEATYELIKEVSSRRKTTAYVVGTMASAGVWIFSACGKIVSVGKTRVIGSVGVAVRIVDFSELYANWGIHVYDLTNPQSKDKRPDVSTEDGRAVTIALLSAFYDKFLESVIEGRGGKITREQIEELNGTVVLAEKALANGFIDSIQNASLNGINDAETVAETNTGEVKEMDLKQFLSENPDAKAAYEAAISKARAEGHAEGVAAEKKETGERFAKMEPFIMSESYSTRVKAACLGAIVGKEDRTVRSAMDLVEFADEQREASASSESDDEDGNNAQTPPQNPDAMNAEKQQRDVDAHCSVLDNL